MIRKFLLCFVATTISLSIFSQSEAVFESFDYQGVNRFEAKLKRNQYQNPILPGFMPDPSFCRKGDDYYLVNSTFSYFPGVPIWHSKDLVNWKQIGHVFNRPSQLRIGNSQMSGGVYAPDIKYNPHDNLFYLITTGTGYGGTCVYTTDDPKKQNWSDPKPVAGVWGIDPGLFFDDDGKAYIVNNDAPQGTAQYDGHRAIWMREYDYKTGKTVGEKKVVVDKGVHPEDKPIWIEGPHVYKINGIYYLMAAEGGTSDQHSEVVFTSSKPMGPYTPCKINPILTQRDLPQDRVNPVTSAGHADLIQTAAGDWYAIFLACMPYEKNYYNTGRETFMLPVSWQDNQPIILAQGKEIPYYVKKSKEQKKLEKKYKIKGDDLYNPGPLWTAKGLTDRVQFIRNPDAFYTIAPTGELHVAAKPVGIHERKNPAFMGQRLTSWYFTTTTSLRFSPTKLGEFAGMVLFQNETNVMQFGKMLDSVSLKPMLVLEARSKGLSINYTKVVLPDAEAQSKLELRVKALKPDLYVFSYSSNAGKSWKQIGEPVDAKILSTEVATGFQGASVGVYATSVFKKGN